VSNKSFMNGAGPIRRNPRSINELPAIDTKVGYFILSQI